MIYIIKYSISSSKFKDILFAMSVRVELDYDNLKNENILKIMKQLELESLR